jgi:hypothetical protein
MDKVLDPSPLRLNCYALGGLDVDGMKCLVTTLNVKADGIYHCVSASNRISDRPFVANVRLDRLNVRIIRAEKSLTAFRMP